MAKGNNRRSRLRRPIPVWMLCLLEVVAVGVCLLIYAYFHHVQPQHIKSPGVVSERPGAAQVLESDASADAAGGETLSGGAHEMRSGSGDEPKVLTADTPAPTAAQTDRDVTAAEVEAAVQPMQLPAPAETASPAVTEEAGEVIVDNTLEPTPTPDPPGYFGTKFADKFTNGEVTFTENSYQSPNVSITLETKKAAGADVHVADIYIRDISCFKAILAFDRVDKNIRESVKDMARRHNTLVSLTGDFYSMRGKSIVLRNGVLYRDKKDPEQDLCVLYWDGHVETQPAKDFDVYREIDRGAYQIWSFGPMLLDSDGNAMSTFNHDLKTVYNGLTRKRARTAFGYYEPGHYCFVAVDYGTTETHGYSMATLSKLMNTLGCKCAYNFDGGQSAQLYVGTRCYNLPENGGRKISDMLAIVEPTQEEMER